MNLPPEIHRLAPTLTQVITPGVGKQWFSFDTCVAVAFFDASPFVRKNQWGTTTGRHLNMIDGGDPEAVARRLPLEPFLDAVGEVFR